MPLPSEKCFNGIHKLNLGIKSLYDDFKAGNGKIDEFYDSLGLFTGVFELVEGCMLTALSAPCRQFVQGIRDRKADHKDAMTYLQYRAFMVPVCFTGI